jgi:hypothetical protein
MPKTTPPTMRALCCECGQLRTVANMGEIEWDDNLTDDGGDPRGWRMTATLECGVCGRWTRHAFLLPDDDAQDATQDANSPIPRPTNSSDYRLRDVHRRIRNILKVCPATDWTLEQSSAVLEALGDIFIPGAPARGQVS